LVGTPKAFIAAFHATSFTDVVPAIINTGTIAALAGFWSCEEALVYRPESFRFENLGWV